MPVIFVHGVNTREGADYRQNLAVRNKLLDYFVLKPLAGKGERFEQIEIVSPYWGKYGVRFRWNQASLPNTSTLEHLGSDTVETPESDLTFVETIKQLAGSTQRGALEALGGEESQLKRAAEKDLTRFLEAVLSPIILSEMDLAVEGDESPEMLGHYEALLLIACQELAEQSDIKQELAFVESDNEVLDILKEALLVRYEQLLAPPEEVALEDSRLEELGDKSFSELSYKIQELFDRCKDAPKRVLTLPPFSYYREEKHRNFSQFMGDVFIYLNERDCCQKPGIIKTVVDAIRQAARHHPDEPLIVITHSMGGNIMYDILTHYVPDLQVDAWISVGGQVGQFEEMKLFKSSDKTIGAPDKVKGLKPRVGFWLNVYDPADPFGFKAAPIFADALDEEFLTGARVLKSHRQYFKLPSFYKMLYKHLEEALV